MAKNKEHVAMTRCFYCGQPDRILLATRYNMRGEPLADLSEANGRAVDMEPCPKCKELMGKGIILVGVRDGEGRREEHRTGAGTSLSSPRTPLTG